MKIIDIEGVGPAMASKLEAAGCKTTNALLEMGCTAKGRKEIAAKSGIDEKKLLVWVNHCDLMRVKGVGSQYADLLEAAGVDTVKELATRRADNLLAKVLEVNAAKKLVRRPPAASMVESWVAEAKKLPGMVTH